MFSSFHELKYFKTVSINKITVKVVIFFNEFWHMFPFFFFFLFRKLFFKIVCRGDSLVAQWLRICLPMQGTRVRALVWEDHTCRGATMPVSHNY